MSVGKGASTVDSNDILIVEMNKLDRNLNLSPILTCMAWATPYPI